MNTNFILNFLEKHPPFDLNNRSILYWHDGDIEQQMVLDQHNNYDYDSAAKIFDLNNQWNYDVWSQLWNQNDIFIKTLSFEQPIGPRLHYTLFDEDTLRWNALNFEMPYLIVSYNTRRQNNNNIQKQWLLWDFVFPLYQWVNIWFSDTENEEFARIWYLDLYDREKDLYQWYLLFKKIGLPYQFNDEHHKDFMANCIERTWDDILMYYSPTKNIVENDLYL